MLRDTLLHEEFEKLVDHVLGSYPSIDLTAQVLPGKLVDDVEYLKRAASGEETLKLIQNTDIDVLITDLNMKGMDGIQLTEQIRKMLLRVQVIIRSSSTERVYISKSLGSGAKAYIDKTSGLDALLETIRNIALDNLVKFND